MSTVMDEEVKHWAFAECTDAVLELPLAPDSLVGRHEIGIWNQFAFDGEIATMHIDENFNVCIDMSLRYLESQSPCAVRGRFDLADAENGFFDFDLVHGGLEDLGFRGRGWVEQLADGPRIALVGSDGDIGLGLVTRPKH